MSVIFKNGSTSNYGDTFVFHGPDGTYRATRADDAFDQWWASGLPIDAWLGYQRWLDQSATSEAVEAVAQ